jgi:hypothetical protein
MSTALKINGATYYPITDACATNGPDAGVYYALPPYGHPPRIGPEENDWETIEFPAIDGCWTKDRGFRRRGIQIQLVIVGTSKADAEGRYLACQGNFIQRARYTIQFPGGNSFQGCKLVTGQADLISEDAWQGGYCIVVMSCLFVQLSRTNG